MCMKKIRVLYDLVYKPIPQKCALHMLLNKNSGFYKPLLSSVQTPKPFSGQIRTKHVFWV